MIRFKLPVALLLLFFGGIACAADPLRIAAAADLKFAMDEIVKLHLEDLTGSAFDKIAIANPEHAPYGKRAEQALRAAGLWDKIEPKLVYGENIAQTAQFVESGNAQIGLIALSLALSPELASKGGYSLIPDSLHEPLEQGFIITRRAAGNPVARDFADYFGSKTARATLVRYGFAPPGEVSTKAP
jgi:molybdate transport system substrate-binding protein